MLKTAVISECGTYRYRLGRAWDEALPRLAFIGLNPSIGDAEIDDPTIRKCIGFGRRLGYGSIEMGNLFAFRATDPEELKKAGFQEGPDNTDHLRAIITSSDMVICAWGSNAANLAQPHKVIGLMKYWDRKPMALRLNAGNIPAHPLYLPYVCTPVEIGS